MTEFYDIIEQRYKSMNLTQLIKEHRRVTESDHIKGTERVKRLTLLRQEMNLRTDKNE